MGNVKLPRCGDTVLYHYDRNGKTQTRAAIVARDPVDPSEPFEVDLRVIFVFADGMAVGDNGDRAKVRYREPTPGNVNGPSWSWRPA